VLPYPQHSPAVPIQLARDESVTAPVSGEFSSPECAVARGLRRVRRAAVPKAPVYEHRDTPLCETFAQDHKIDCPYITIVSLSIGGSYSYRKADIGSTCTARRVGIHAATMAVTIKIRNDEAAVQGSKAPKLKREDLRICPTAYAQGNPSSNPTPACPETHQNERL
jgi:hypothetical protein